MASLTLKRDRWYHLQTQCHPTEVRGLVTRLRLDSTKSVIPEWAGPRGGDAYIYKPPRSHLPFLLFTSHRDDYDLTTQLAIHPLTTPITLTPYQPQPSDKMTRTEVRAHTPSHLSPSFPPVVDDDVVSHITLPQSAHADSPSSPCDSSWRRSTPPSPHPPRPSCLS